MTMVNITEPGAVLSLPRERKEMLSVGVDASGRTKVRINSSSISIIQECPRKAQYSLREGWKAADESPATLFGRAIHKALEVYYMGEPEERVLPKFEHVELMAFGHKPPPTNNDLIYRAISAFVEVAQPLAPLPETDKRSIQNGIWILYEYFKTYIDDPYVAYVDEAGPFIERTFSYTVHEDPTLVVEVFGTIDFAFRHLRTGEITLGDHKTSSFLRYGDSSYFDREKPNHQYTLYMLGANRVFGIKTENFCVNVIEVKAKPKTAEAKGVSFPRQITRRTEEDFEELQEVIMKAVRDYLYMSSTGVWPQGPVGSCTAYGACSFKQICAAPKSMRETILKGKFINEISRG